MHEIDIVAKQFDANPYKHPFNREPGGDYCFQCGSPYAGGRWHVGKPVRPPRGAHDPKCRACAALEAARAGGVDVNDDAALEKFCRERYDNEPRAFWPCDTVA